MLNPQYGKQDQKSNQKSSQSEIKPAKESEKEQKEKSRIKKKEVNILSGFFPVFIYFDVQLNSQTLQIKKQLLQILTIEDIRFQTLKQTHLTVTRTINILQSEVKQIHKKIQRSMKGRLHFPFVLLFKKVVILQNFICLEVQKITELKLKSIAQIIGQTIKNPYFSQPVYHVSLFKLFQSPTQQLKQKIQKIEIKSKTAMLLSNLTMNSGIKKIKLSIK